MKRLFLLGGIVLLGTVVVGFSGCMTPTAGQHSEQLGSEAEREMTVGVVQKEIRKGIS